MTYAHLGGLFISIFFDLDGLGDVVCGLDQFRIGVFHQIHDAAGELEHKRFVQAERLAVIEGAAQNQPQHIPAAFV